MTVKRVIRMGLLFFFVVIAFPPGADALEGMRSLWVGDRAGSFVRHTVGGETRLWDPGGATVIVFWARWSRPSLDALRDIVAAAPRSAAHWEIVPINVDRAVLSPREAVAVEAAARKTGYEGPVWHDVEFERTRHWGLVATPTVLITGLGGVVEAMEVGWTADQRRRIVSTYFGAVNDTSPPLTIDTLRTRCRRELGLARLLWRSGADDSAFALAARAQVACPTLPDPSILQAWWHWEKRDTLAARAAATAAIAVDSVSPWAWVTMGEIELRCGRQAEARQLGQRALSLDSGFAPGWSILASSALEAGDTLLVRAAISVLEGRCRHDPEFAAARARLRERAGDASGAVADWRLAVEGRLREHRDRRQGPLAR
jgi:hypothetical protein